MVFFGYKNVTSSILGDWKTKVKKTARLTKKNLTFNID